MFIAELFNGAPQQHTEIEPKNELVAEANAPQLVALYPGRFQPFHMGHNEVFQALQNKFGRDNVFIATSNKTDANKSPFNFTDKVQLMNAAGVPTDRILETASPYKLPAQFDAANTIFVVVVGAPDAARLQPDSTKKDGSESYFKMFKSLAECTTADKHGYCIIADERHKVITLLGQQVDVSHGTPSRQAWNMVRNDPKGRAEYMTQMFGRNDPELGRILDKIPASVGESLEEGIFDRFKKKPAADPVNEPITDEERAFITKHIPSNNADIKWADGNHVLPQNVTAYTGKARINFYKRGGQLIAGVGYYRSSSDAQNPKVSPIGHFDEIISSAADVEKLKTMVAEGIGSKLAAGALAGAMATGAGGIVLNPARPIAAATANALAPTVANPYPAAAAPKPARKSTEIKGKEYIRHELPSDMSKVEIVTDDSGYKVYAWIEKTGMRPQYTYYWFAPTKVNEGAPIVVMPMVKPRKPARAEHQPSPVVSPYRQGIADATAGKPYINPYPFKKELGAPGNQEHNGYRQGYQSVQQANESATNNQGPRQLDPEELDSLVTSIGQKAKQGPMKTVWVPDQYGKGGRYKVVPVTDAPVEEDAAPMSREDYMTRRKSLQQLQMDPKVTRDPAVRKELIKKIAQLTMQARSAGVLPESVYAAHVQENRLFEARAIVNTIKYLKESAVEEGVVDHISHAYKGVKRAVQGKPSKIDVELKHRKKALGHSIDQIGDLANFMTSRGGKQADDQFNSTQAKYEREVARANKVEKLGPKK